MGLRDRINESAIGKLVNDSRIGMLLEGKEPEREPNKGIKLDAKCSTMEHKAVQGGGFWNKPGVKSTAYISHTLSSGISALIELYFAKDAILINYSMERKETLPATGGCIYGFRKQSSKGIEPLLGQHELAFCIDEFDAFLQESYGLRIEQKPAMDCHYMLKASRSLSRTGRR